MKWKIKNGTARKRIVIFDESRLSNVEESNEKVRFVKKKKIFAFKKDMFVS